MSKLERYRERERALALTFTPRHVLADAIRNARSYGLHGLACGFYGARACRSRGES